LTPERGETAGLASICPFRIRADVVPRVGMSDIEYRCPTHGPVEPENLDAAVPTCPLTIRRQVGGTLVPEPCGQPLTAYLK
jgi:hypothetical protein